MKTISALVAMLSAMIPAIACSQDGAPPDWAEQCATLRAEGATDASLRSTYQDWPADVSAPTAWQLTYRGLHVTIPVANYDRASLSRSPSGWSVIVQDQAQHIIVHGSAMEDTAMSDVFGAASPGGAVLTTDEGIALTETLFGGPVTISRLMDLGFEHTPETLTCASEAWRSELGVAVAVTLKAVAASDNVARRRADDRGWVLTRQRESHSSVQHMVPIEGELVDVTISLPANVDPVSFALAPTDDPAPGQPEWVGTLEAALADGSDEAVRAAAEAMRAAGLDVTLNE